MAEVLEINGKTFYAIKDAVSLVSYSRDYITRLAREKKIIAMYVGRQWFVDVQSLKQYVEVMSLEQQIRKDRLSEERKRDLFLRAQKEQRETGRGEQVRTMHFNALAVAGVVLCCGVITGLTSYELWSQVRSAGVQVATTFDSQNVTKDTNSSLGVSNDEQLVTNRVVEEHLNLSVTNGPTTTSRSLGDVATGVLLLPSQGTSTEVADLFSDPVVVKESMTGTMVVSRVTDSGATVGPEIPFVLVPVKQKNP